MSFIELFILAVGLSMDAFAVSVCKGLSVSEVKPKHMLIAGGYFGAFQALMPCIGYFLGSRFIQYIEAFDHWIAFALLAIIGISMIRSSFKQDEEQNDDFSFKAMILLAVATSIDALAVGITFACLDVKVLPAVLLIGVTTFVISAAGIKIGNLFGSKYRSKAELVGGIILILIGLKIILEHLGVIKF